MTTEQLQEQLHEALAAALRTLPYYDESIAIELEIPKDKTNGDLSTNLAMKYARVARKAPLQIAEEIVAALTLSPRQFERIEVARPGFINFYVNPKLLLQTINQILEEQHAYGDSDLGKDEHYNIEFVSVNPTGAIHIGHARGAAVGDAMCRILTKAGYRVTREYYVNDAGNQIHNLARSIEARYRQLFDARHPMVEDGYHGPEIIDLAKRIRSEYGRRFLDEDGYEFFREYGVSTLLEALKADLERFGVTFDVWFSERSLYANNEVERVVTLLKEQGNTYEKDGALWLKTSEHGDEKDRVIIKSDGSYTYVTPDIAYHKNKLDRGYTKLIDILGGDHHGYINRLKAAIEMVGGKSDLLEVELLQMVKVLQNGEEVKMSKRSGKAITLGDLIDEVGTDPIRYFFAARSLNTQMDLDLDLAIRQTNENPVYYVQYAHARMHSIFETARVRKMPFEDGRYEYETIDNDKAIELVAHLANYPQTIKHAASTRSPHRVVQYLYQLATLFHSFYNSEPIIQTDQLRSQERLALVKATQIVLQDGLALIGVSAPTSM
jgi:arginyl-tRNA synthetase